MSILGLARPCALKLPTIGKTYAAKARFLLPAPPEFLNPSWLPTSIGNALWQKLPDKPRWSMSIDCSIPPETGKNFTGRGAFARFPGEEMVEKLSGPSGRLFSVLRLQQGFL